MHSRTRSGTRSRTGAGLWLSVALVLSAINVVRPSLPDEGRHNVAQGRTVCAGPIEDTIEYLLWLLRQLS